MIGLFGRNDYKAIKTPVLGESLTMNLFKFSTVAAIALISTLAVCLAKDDSNVKKDKEVVEAPKSDSAPKSSEASSDEPASDFNIEQLLKLIESLKNQDFEELDKTLKDVDLEGGEKNLDETVEPEEDVDYFKEEEKKDDKKEEKKDEKKEGKKDSKKEESKDNDEDEDEKLEL